jgi:hypothetical protein
MAKTRSKKRGQKKTYTRKHYQSNDGMLTSVWGPSAWHFLHTMSFNYPMNPTCDDKRNYRNHILNLQHVLPCGKCRINLKKNIAKLPLRFKDMRNRTTFSKYVYKLHELINKMLGKKSGLTYDDVRERYEHFRSRCSLSSDEQEELDRLAINGKKIENGCTEPVYGEKSKCILQIVPQTTKCDTFQMDKKCIKQR